MKKKCVAVLLSFLLVLSLAVPAFAGSVPGTTQVQVEGADSSVTGGGTIIVVDTEVIEVTLPTGAGFNFVMDPMGLHPFLDLADGQEVPAEDSPARAPFMGLVHHLHDQAVFIGNQSTRPVQVDVEFHIITTEVPGYAGTAPDPGADPPYAGGTGAIPAWHVAVAQNRDNLPAVAPGPGERPAGVDFEEDARIMLFINASAEPVDGQVRVRNMVRYMIPNYVPLQVPDLIPNPDYPGSSDIPYIDDPNPANTRDCPDGTMVREDAPNHYRPMQRRVPIMIENPDVDDNTHDLYGVPYIQTGTELAYVYVQCEDTPYQMDGAAFVYELGAPLVEDVTWAPNALVIPVSSSFDGPTAAEAVDGDLAAATLASMSFLFDGADYAIVRDRQQASGFRVDVDDESFTGTALRIGGFVNRNTAVSDWMTWAGATEATVIINAVFTLDSAPTTVPAAGDFQDGPTGPINYGYALLNLDADAITIAHGIPTPPFVPSQVGFFNTAARTQGAQTATFNLHGVTGAFTIPFHFGDTTFLDLNVASGGAVTPDVGITVVSGGIQLSQAIVESLQAAAPATRYVRVAPLATFAVTFTSVAP
ncbi:MAG: hypothetical protein FWB91_02720 [Defluviitaleaceae bacterium]|nr:hypothetical protein [Defluviitaleaceae bacterium]